MVSPDTRYDTPAAGSHGHNVPLIDGARQHDGATARGRVEEVLVEPALAVLRCDISPTYDVEGLEVAQRELRLTATSLELRDRFAASRPIEIVDRLVSFFPIELDRSGAVIRGTRSVLRVAFAGTAWRASVRPIAYRGHGGALISVNALDLRCVAAEAELAVTMDVLSPAERLGPGER